MKAAITTKYGPPEVLEVREVSKPSPKKNELLIKNLVAAVNYGDTRIRRLQEPEPLRFVMRLMLGFNRPKQPILGTAFSGIVEEIGSEVSNFIIGDEVFGLTGMAMGAHAQYLTIAHDRMVAKKPPNATFTEAAAVVLGAHTAIYFLQQTKITEKNNLQVLIYGAGGAVGTAAVQIAKHYRAIVTAVCSTAGQQLANNLGADYVILYDQEDFRHNRKRYDVIFDAVGKITKNSCRKSLTEAGQYVSVDFPNSAKEHIEQLTLVRTLFEDSKYQAVIDQTFPLNEIVEAHRYVDTKRKKGNVVITLW